MDDWTFFLHMYLHLQLENKPNEYKKLIKWIKNKDYFLM